MNRTVAYAYAGVVLTMFFWGSAFNAMSYIIQHMPPLSAASERFSIASRKLASDPFNHRQTKMGSLKSKFTYLSYYWGCRHCRIQHRLFLWLTDYICCEWCFNYWQPHR